MGSFFCHIESVYLQVSSHTAQSSFQTNIRFGNPIDAALINRQQVVNIYPILSHSSPPKKKNKK